MVFPQTGILFQGETDYELYLYRTNYISNLLHSGVDLRFVQAQVGHTDVTTALKYYYRITENIETRKQALLPSLAKLEMSIRVESVWNQ